jgi:PAS domain S-box-containing protein
MLDLFRRLRDPGRRRLEKRLQLAMSAGKMAAWEASPDGHVHWWSPEMFALHGRDPREGVPRDYFALVFPEDRERVLAVVGEAVRACADHTVQDRIAWPVGSVHWLEGSGTTLCDEGGRPDTMIGVCVNIDARKDEELHLQFLAQASDELAALTDYEATMARVARLAVPHFADWCAVDMLDPARGLVRVAVAHVDEETVRLAHELHERYPPDPEAAGGTWNVARSGQPELVPVITDEMLASTISDAQQLQAMRSLGLHSYMGVPLVAGGRVLGVMSFITSESRRVFTERDLTRATDLAGRAAVAIRNAELMDTLRRADAAKDVFLATLAHELRNPLAPIVNSVALLSRADDPAARLPDALRVIQRQATHLTRLVDDLLDLARINSGKIELRREVLDLRDVLRAAIESSQPLIDRREHALAVELPGGSAWVDGDPVRLAQVFSNLLTNAAKYTPPGGRIELQLLLVDDSVQVRVSDTGIGIAPELLPRVFALFTQASRANDLDQQGLGIGLYLVEGLVHMHGGSIAADSRGPGQGSRFTVTLPRAPAPATTVPQAAPATQTRPRRQVLVVDDNTDAAQTLAELLEILGHATTTAHDGASALAAFQAFEPDVVLLDIGLPDMDGYQVARRIRERGGAHTRLVALTGWGQAEDKRRATQAGFDMHWTKPVDPARLEEI